MMNKAVFFDRDGVLNVDTGYPHRIEDMILIEGAPEAIAMAHAQGYKIFIVTNQGGLALNYFDWPVLNRFNQELLARLKAQDIITDIAICPHHPDAPDPAMRHCQCRKPSPKMIVDLADQHDIDLASSLMIGDRDSDVEAGLAAGCQAFLFEGGRLDEFIAPLLEASTS